MPGFCGIIKNCISLVRNTVFAQGLPEWKPHLLKTVAGDTEI